MTVKEFAEKLLAELPHDDVLYLKTLDIDGCVNLTPDIAIDFDWQVLNGNDMKLAYIYKMKHFNRKG